MIEWCGTEGVEEEVVDLPEIGNRDNRKLKGSTVGLELLLEVGRNELGNGVIFRAELRAHFGNDVRVDRSLVCVMRHI